MASNGHRGRVSSWVAVTLITLGFAVGGVALTMGPEWWLVWVGAALVGVGGVIALAIDIFDDVVMDQPRVLPEQPHHTPLHHHDD